MRRDALIDHLTRVLQAESFKDMGTNGLQVEGRPEISHVALGVSASLAFMEAAQERGADLLLVHHGILWNGMDPVVRGPYRERLAFLLAHEMNLIAYHLPLDAHPELGNNAQIARRLGFGEGEAAFPYHGSPPIGRIVKVDDLPVVTLKDRLVELFGEPIIHLDEGPERLQRIGIVSGGAQSEFGAALVEKCDAYVTGEISEYVVDMAREAGAHFFCCGHYRTEQFGVQALGEVVRKEFGLPVTFIPLPHPY